MQIWEYYYLDIILLISNINLIFPQNRISTTYKYWDKITTAYGMVVVKKYINFCFSV